MSLERPRVAKHVQLLFTALSEKFNQKSAIPQKKDAKRQYGTAGCRDRPHHVACRTGSGTDGHRARRGTPRRVREPAAGDGLDLPLERRGGARAGAPGAHQDHEAARGRAARPPAGPASLRGARDAGVAGGGRERGVHRVDRRRHAAVTSPLVSPDPSSSVPTLDCQFRPLIVSSDSSSSVPTLYRQFRLLIVSSDSSSSAPTPRPWSLESCMIPLFA